MKYFLSIIAAIVFIGCEKKESSHETEIKLFQYELNIEFSDATKSPLTEEDLKTFKALEFFDIDENYNIEADFELTPNTPIFEMPTTTDRLPLYRKYGIARFTLNGKKMELSIYQNQQLMTDFNYKDYLFLPFNDATNGTTTYGGGRFIDLEIPKEGSKKIRIDFNKAYNPYCAYNHTFSCPIPPKENNLSVAIPVGVKAFKQNH
ncbi:MAG: hypothetical protein CVU08_11280 [Bacteroidetes bacterium HGW-Bacteroidetes-3]|nr:MAG: hypothetical protein CVU08_11280 [Bacteroidetes bacterium HGW-Bacteroidetes-3]